VRSEGLETSGKEVKYLLIFSGVLDWDDNDAIVVKLDKISINDDLIKCFTIYIILNT